MPGRSSSTNKFATADTSESYIINESARKQLGYASSSDVIGKPIRQWGRDGRIIGVVENFHVSSLRSEIAPLSLAIYPGTARYLTLRLASDDLRATVKSAHSDPMAGATRTSRGGASGRFTG